ncbi:MAG: DUF1640 domain-containing protein [Roseiarcus sp.]
MSVVLIDTHAFIKRLTAAGMPEAQAEVLADEQTRLIDERLASKSDIVALATKIDAFATRSDMRETEPRLEAKIETTKAEILNWMFGTIGFQTIVILGGVLALSRFGH